MIPPNKLVEGVTEQLSRLMSSTELPGQKEMQQQVHALLQSTFARLDLVTRDEFEAQKAVLLRTREKLELLEQRVAELEAQSSGDALPSVEPGQD